MNPSELDALVAQLYSSAAGQTSWSSVLETLAQNAHAWTLHLVGLDKSRGGVVFSHHGGKATAQTNLDYIRTYHRLDPRTVPMLATPEGKWFHCHEHFDERFVANDPFYQDFLIPYGGRYVSIAKVVDDPQMMVCLGVHRGQGSQPVESSTLEWLDRIATHMREGMSIYRRLRAMHYEHAVGRQLLDQLHYPIMLVDSMRGILYANRASREALIAGDYVVNRSGVLCCRRRDDDTALTQALLAMDSRMDDAVQLRKGRRHAIRIHRAKGGGHVVTYVSVLRPADVLGAFGAANVALLIFHDPRAIPRPDSFILSEAFDLTPAEARVALELSAGQTAEQVAAKRGVALDTVRSQIKSLFAKTGVHRQSELMRLVLTSPPGL
jgi:DNA-binding CsgD family transcriptional regulator